MAPRQSDFGVVHAWVNSIPSALRSHGSAVVSIGRVGGAVAGVGLAGLAPIERAGRQAVRGVLSVGCAACLWAGIPACMRLEVAR